MNFSLAITKKESNRPWWKSDLKLKFKWKSRNMPWHWAVAFPLLTMMLLDHVCVISHNNYGFGYAKPLRDSFSHMRYFSFKTLLIPMTHISSSSPNWKLALSENISLVYKTLVCTFICDYRADLADQSQKGTCSFFFFKQKLHKKKIMVVPIEAEDGVGEDWSLALWNII